MADIYQFLASPDNYLELFLANPSRYIWNLRGIYPSQITDASSLKEEDIWNLRGINTSQITDASSSSEEDIWNFRKLHLSGITDAYKALINKIDCNIVFQNGSVSYTILGEALVVGNENLAEMLMKKKSRLVHQTSDFVNKFYRWSDLLTKYRYQIGEIVYEYPVC
jgi:hypothetical protein